MASTIYKIAYRKAKSALMIMSMIVSGSFFTSSDVSKCLNELKIALLVSVVKYAKCRAI